MKNATMNVLEAKKIKFKPKYKYEEILYCICTNPIVHVKKITSRYIRIIGTLCNVKIEYSEDLISWISETRVKRSKKKLSKMVKHELNLVHLDNVIRVNEEIDRL